MTKRDLIPRIGRWWLLTQEFDFEVEYRPGSKIAHADALSRNPVGDATPLHEMDIFLVNIDDEDWVLSAQLQDERCKYIHEVLSRDPVDKEEKAIHQNFTLVDAKVYRKTPDGKRWLVPRHARRQLITFHHEGKGHLGVEKTLSSIAESYWFPGMRRYIGKYIKGCLGCLYNKQPSGRRQGLLNPIEKVPAPMHTIHIDHLGPFVRSKRKNTHLIVVVDAFTKFVFLKAVQSTKTKPLVNMLQNIFELFGVPNRIICDRGSCQTSKTFKDFCQALGVKIIYNATATPRANGQVERYNRTILNSLTASTDEEEKWDHQISIVQWGLNSTVNATTGKTPYEVFFGYKPRGFSDAFLRNEVEVEQNCDDIETIRREAANRTVQMQLENKKRYDSKRAKAIQYEVGQQVLVRRTLNSNDGKSRKLLPKYDGPFVITKVLGCDRYNIADLEGSRRSNRRYTGVCAADQMKPFTTNCQSDSEQSAQSENEN